MRCSATGRPPPSSGATGSIDWLCWPRFDSSACFARLLGDDMNGRWLIAPTDASAKTSRSYRDKTLILETHYATAEGAAVVIDFLPADVRPDCHLVRIVRGLRGTVAFQTDLIIRTNYGTAIPWIEPRRGWQSARGRRARRAHFTIAYRPPTG